MIIARLGYVTIALVIVTAAIAVTVVLRSGDDGPQTLSFQQVVDYSRYGVIDSIKTSGEDITVHFRQDFDTRTQFDTDSHDFKSKLPKGENLLNTLEANGVKVNGADGIRFSIK